MRRFKNKVICFLRETQEEVKGVKKGAIATLCYIELIVIVVLLEACLVMGAQVFLSSKLVEQVEEVKDEALVSRDEAISNAAYYKCVYEDVQEAYKLYQEEHPDK